MSINAVCPGCHTVYQLADSLLGKKVRCKSCSETFVVGDEDTTANSNEEQAIQSSLRPAKRVPRLAVDEVAGRPEPRRRPRKKSSNSALPLIIVCCIAGGVLLLGLGGVTIWAVSRSLKSQATPVGLSNDPPVNAPRPGQDPAPPPNRPGMPRQPERDAAANNPNGGNANMPPVNRPAPQGQLEVELTNGKVSGFGAQMQVEVDYRFTAGNPGGKRIFLVIKATKAGGLRQSYYLADLKSIRNQTDGTVRASGMSFGIEHGPFEMWMGETDTVFGLPSSDRDIRKISNVVTVATRQMAPPGPGVRPPFGPRRPPGP